MFALTSYLKDGNGTLITVDPLYYSPFEHSKPNFDEKLNIDEVFQVLPPISYSLLKPNALEEIKIDKLLKVLLAVCDALRLDQIDDRLSAVA